MIIRVTAFMQVLHNMCLCNTGLCNIVFFYIWSYILIKV